MFHVSSALNRESILAHGLDWSRMSATRGIAGSLAPEVEGVYLCRDEYEAANFAQMNNTGGPVDIWTVDGIEERQLTTDAGSGYCYLPAVIPPGQLTLAAPAPATVDLADRRSRKTKQRKKPLRTRGGRGSRYRKR